MRARGIRLLGLALSLTACGAADEPELGAPERHRIPGCEQYDPAPCDVETETCQQRLIDIAACLRGSDDTTLPAVLVMTENEYASYLAAEYAKRAPAPHLAEWEQALVMLGLIAPKGLEDQARVAEAVDFVWGFYDEETKGVTLIDHGADSNSETSSAVLVHEFVHVLQDREVDLTTFRGADASYDGELAADAIVEGEAQFQQQRYLASMLGFDPRRIDWDRLFQNAVDDAETHLFEQDSVMTAAWDLFPYAWGSRFLHLGWDASGHSGVLDLFASPPADTAVEMASVEARAPDVDSVAIVAPEAPTPWTLVGEDRIGAFGTFELLGKSTQIERARELALAWRGDELAVYVAGEEDPNHTNPTVVVWVGEFMDAPSAAAAAGLLLTQGVTKLNGTRVTVAQASDASDVSWAFASAAP